MENRLDKLFRDHLSKHEEIPSAGSWNQLQDQLIKKRRVVWGKRVAVAASILLIAAVGIVQYQSLVSLDLKNNQVVTKSDQTILENENQITQKAEEIVVENVDIDEQIESQISKNLQEENVKNTISGRNTKAHRAPEMPEEVHKRQKPLVAEAEVDDQKVIGSDDIEQINTRSIEVDF